MYKQRKIILASTSDGRKNLLEQIGLSFTAEASNYEEDLSLSLEPAELVTVLSQGKARAVAARHSDAIVIGVDSVAVLNGKILGKPRDQDDATRMLQKMSGKSHLLMSGLTIIDTKSGEEVSSVSETRVSLRKLTGREISDYVASGEPMKCAGSYAIQGKGAALIEKIEGEYSNVVGLPLGKLATILQEFSINILAAERKSVRV